METIYCNPQLPLKYAEELLDCQIEFQLNKKISSKILIKLVQLYKIGIEYYESIRSYKYLYFQRKMNAIVKSQKILSSLNDKKNQQGPAIKPQILVIQSLSDFKKQKIFTEPASQQKDTKAHPFKKHLQHKFYIQNIQEINAQKQLKMERQAQFKRLIELEHQQKQQQFAQTLTNLQSDKVFKNFIDTQYKKLSCIESKFCKAVQDQEQQFQKKLKERREKVIQKKALTKSYSDRDSKNYQSETSSNNQCSKTTEL